MKKIFILLMMALATCNISAKSNFVQVKDGHFVRDGKPYYYVGTNFWYREVFVELEKIIPFVADNISVLIAAVSRFIDGLAQIAYAGMTLDAVIEQDLFPKLG